MVRKILVSPVVLGLVLMGGCGGSGSTEDPCVGVDCSGHGTCSGVDGRAVCDCDTGYAGDRCESCAPGYRDDGSGTCVEETTCQADSCSGHGQCDDSTGSVVCTCDTGYAGDHCESCAPGYVDDGSGNCIEESTTCQADSCSGHGQCDDSTGSIVCTCDTGYTGNRCQDCDTGYHSDGNGNCVPDTGGPHPQGWASPDQHGDAAKHGQMDCRTCHGADLGGQGEAPSCDTCHQAGWRTNCTFCHGGTDNQTGAPPVDLDGNTDSTVATVGAHTEHVDGANHMKYDCNQCHVKPTDVLSPGHIFDDTPGEAEVDLSNGLSNQGVFDGTGCSSLYCHGDGRNHNGSMASFTATIDTCDACHEVPPPTGKHRFHINMVWITCKNCHNSVASNNSTISGPDLHVNGQHDIDFSLGGTYDPNTRSCNPTCHGTKTWPSP